jgi:phage terminase small subunit
MEGMTKLTPRQDAFVREYLVDLNGKQAAIRAGYSERSAESTASALLRVPKVAQAVAEAQNARSRRTEVSADRVLQELARVAFADLSKAFDSEGNLRKPHELPDDVRTALQGIDYAKSGDRIARFSEKTRALELVGKHLGMFRERVDVGSDGDKALQVTVKVLKPEDG